MYQEEQLILIRVVNAKTDETFTTYLSSLATIQELKCQIQAESGLLYSNQILFFNKKMLLKDNQRLIDLGVGDRAVINLQPKEAKGPSFQFNDLSNKQILGTRKSKTGMRTLYPGLLLEAICQNQKCRAYKKRILVRKGFGQFNIGRQVSNCKCQLCGELTDQAFNMGFFNTKVKIQGKKQGQKQPIALQFDVNGQQYHTFKHQGSRDLTKWNFLQVEAKPIKQ